MSASSDASCLPVSKRRASSPPPPRLDAVGLTHTGLVRDTNEDAFAVVPQLGFCAVADGVGGNAAGEVASRMAMDVVVSALERASTSRAGLAAPALVRAVQEANAAVCVAALGDQAMAGMATTFTGVLLLGDRAVVAHVGDSRAYFMRGRRLHQLTDDHTLVGALVRAGQMTSEEAATSEIRNVIMRSIGGNEALEVDWRTFTVERGDTLLLASDGLHGVVADADIAATLLSERDPTRAAAQLVERANNAGGPDNVTVVVVRLG
jgi:serine/threonine protein phosphatase PrpC